LCECIDKVLCALQSLTSIISNINKFYGRQILFALSSAFICITVQLYYLIIHMRFGFAGIALMLAFCSCILIIIHLVEFGVVLLAGDKIVKEVSECRLSIVEDCCSRSCPLGTQSDAATAAGQS